MLRGIYRVCFCCVSEAISTGKHVCIWSKSLDLLIVLEHVLDNHDNYRHVKETMTTIHRQQKRINNPEK